MFVNDLNQKIPLFFLSVPKGKFFIQRTSTSGWPPLRCSDFRSMMAGKDKIFSPIRTLNYFQKKHQSVSELLIIILEVGFKQDNSVWPGQDIKEVETCC